MDRPRSRLLLFFPSFFFACVAGTERRYTSPWHSRHTRPGDATIGINRDEAVSLAEFKLNTRVRGGTDALASVAELEEREEREKQKGNERRSWGRGGKRGGGRWIVIVDL